MAKAQPINEVTLKAEKIEIKVDGDTLKIGINSKSLDKTTVLTMFPYLVKNGLHVDVTLSTKQMPLSTEEPVQSRMAEDSNINSDQVRDDHYLQPI